MFEPHCDLKAHTGLGIAAIRRLRGGLADSAICQLIQLLQMPGVGDKTLEKCFTFALMGSAHPTKTNHAFETEGKFDF